jgi:signal transduction histidine kinase
VGRYLLAAGVVVADAALHMAGRPVQTLWAAATYALVVALVVALCLRWALVAFVAALVLASMVGGAYILLLWSAYHAGRAVRSPSDAAVVVGAALGGLGMQLATTWAGADSVPHILSGYVVFVGLPLLAGRYLAQHTRLVSALHMHNRQLRLKQKLLAEQERLRERLRIARDMHDSLGHRLSLVSIQAAALEVSPLPAEQHRSVEQLAAAARAALGELHELVGTLREGSETVPRSPGADLIGRAVEDFRAAGVLVSLRQRGRPRPLSPATGQAAYRVVEEGLTNAAKHAPGQPVTVSIEWEPDTLLLSVINPVTDNPCAPLRAGTGHGLSGLDERIRPVGGLLDHRLSDGRFRLIAMLPTVPGEEEDEEAVDVSAVVRIQTIAIGVATAILMFVFLPVSMLVGMR